MARSNKRFFSKPVIIILAIMMLLISTLIVRTYLPNIMNVREQMVSDNIVCASPSLTVSLTNTKKGATDPNPIGIYTINFNNTTYDVSLNQRLCIPYLKTVNTILLKIVPKNTSATIAKKKPHYADVFPETYRLDMAFIDASNSILWAVKDSNNSRININNGNLIIEKLGIIYDANGNDVGGVRNDMYDVNKWNIQINKHTDISSIQFNWIVSAYSGTVPKKNGIQN